MGEVNPKERVDNKSAQDLLTLRGALVGKIGSADDIFQQSPCHKGQVITMAMLCHYRKQEG